MKIRNGLLFAVLFLFAVVFVGCGGGGGGSSSGGGGQSANVSGTVLGLNGIPINGAQVTITSNPVTVYTDQNGDFSANVEVGNHELTIELDWTPLGSSIIYTGNFTCEDDSPLNLGDVITTATGVEIQFVVTNNTNKAIVYIQAHSGERDDTIITEHANGQQTSVYPAVGLHFAEGYYFRWRFYNESGEYYQAESVTSEVPFDSDPVAYTEVLKLIFGDSNVSYNAVSKLITISVTVDSYL